MARIHLGDFRQNKTTDGISRDEGVAWREKKMWFLYLEKHLDAWMRGIWGHQSDFSTKTLGVQCVIKTKKKVAYRQRGGGGQTLSLFPLSSLICLSLLSLIYSHGWRYPVMHIYMYQDIHILYRCICMWIILPTFPTAGVVSCLGEVNFSPWNLITHAILIVPIRDLEGTFFSFFK